MLKDLYNRQTVEHMAELSQESVTLAAEGNTDSFRIGDEIRLSQNNGRFCLVDADGKQIRAKICANVPLEEALSLSLAKAAFTIRKISRNVFKAEIKDPYNNISRTGMVWSSLN